MKYFIGFSFDKDLAYQNLQGYVKILVLQKYSSQLKNLFIFETKNPVQIQGFLFLFY